MSAELARTRSRRRLVAAITAGAIVLGAGIAAIILPLAAPDAGDASVEHVPVDSGDQHDENVSEEPLVTTPSVTPAPLSDDEAAEIERASAAVDTVIAAADEIGQRGDGSAVGIDMVATGWALGELQAKAREQYDLGYTQVGEAKITSMTAVEVDVEAEPATMTFLVCVDTTDIDVLDAAGNSLKDSLYNPGHPVAHRYGAIFEDGVWKISTHDIPDTQDCAAA